MSEELMPCPFCGGKAHIKEIVSSCERLYMVGCSDSECMGFETLYAKPTVGEALAAWNHRAEHTCQIVVSVDRSPASHGGRVHRCSSCGKALPGSLFRNGWTKLDYCPRCGARVTEVVRDGD